MLATSENIAISERLVCMEKARVRLIELSTENELTEIENIGRWETAMARVIAKGVAFPKRGLRVHLHGRGSIDSYQSAFRRMNELGIRVTTEPVVRHHLAWNLVVWVGLAYTWGWVVCYASLILLQYQMAGS